MGVKTVTPDVAAAVALMYVAFVGTPAVSLMLLCIVPLQSAVMRLLVVPLLLEVLHCLYYVCLKTYFNNIQDLQSISHPRCDYSHESRMDCWRTLVGYAKAYGIRDWVTTWFGCRYDFDAIDAHSLMFWVRYTVFGYRGSVRCSIGGEDEQRLRPFIAALEAGVGRGFRFKRKTSGAALKKSNAFGLEPIRSVYHPLWFYVIIGGLELYHQRFTLRRLGFTSLEGLQRSNAYRQGCRVLCKISADSRPIVFIHGLGAGLFPYKDVLRRISILGRTVVLVYIPQISMTHAYETPVNESICELIQLALANIAGSGGRRRRSVVEVDVVANSFGTCVASTLVARNRESSTGIRLLCRHLLLIDPVSIALISPDLTARFVYDRRYAAVVDFIVRSEIHIMYCIQRRFDWMDSFISPVMTLVDRTVTPDCDRRDLNNQRIGPRINLKIYVASNDAMVNLERFTRVLQVCFPPQAEVTIMDDTTHGQWIAKEKYIQMVINDLS